MNENWKIFLSSQSASFDEKGWTNFERAASHPTDTLCDLSQLGLIRLTGKDTETFLQGQFTNDIRELTETTCRLDGYCNPKGHMLANGWVFRRGEETFLQLPQEMLQPILKRLTMFVLRSDVKLTDAGDELIRIGLIGNNAEQMLKEMQLEAPATPTGVTHSQTLTIIRFPGETPRYEILGEEPAIEKVWTQLAEKAEPVGSHYWALQDIHAGIPTVYPATVEAFIPQMVNMQLIGGVSFNKGCYCGQEIVARTQHRGTLKRRMYLAHVDSTEAPAPGDELFSASAEHGKAAGIVVDAQPTPDGGYDALIMAQIPCVEADDIRLGDSEEEKLDIHDLPYPFETAN